MLNFARYLERLGIKSPFQPVLLDTVQPVVIVGDHKHLVNHPILQSYLIGGESVLDAVNFGAVLVTTPVPLRLQECHIGVTQATRVHWTIGAAPPPAVLNQVVHTPQSMRLGGPTPVRANWVSGSIVAAPLVTTPLTQAPNTATIAVQTSQILIPAGGWLLLQTAVINTGIRFWISVDELPDDLPQ